MELSSAKESNVRKLEQFCTLSRSVLSELIAGDKDSAFVAPKNTDELSEHNRQVESIIVSKLRKITKI